MPSHPPKIVNPERRKAVEMGVTGSLAWVVSGALAGFVAYCNLPSAWILPAARATSSWLAEAKLEPLPTGAKVPFGLPAIQAADLWQNRSGAVVMAVRRPG